ncbi:SlyX family protein [Massilia yuzhufengensis]|uniref:SlyX protein n=1 Tax=Massilia yuzhufengensis TaxID=1164594 RepID=A0A1I1LBX2_9BURK|nr:SlyX family protein [Massilia yuzhufengensis]SFC70627.1 SlyX protein [Massilia yuzhufengensis]
MSQEDRIVDIEIKLTHQEDLVETLNQTIYRQGRRIDQLEAMVTAMADHVRNLQSNRGGPLNEKPPHY